jgi:hypothetical protein
MSVNDFPHTLESLCGEGTLFKLKSVAPWHEYNDVLDEKDEPKFGDDGKKITVKGKCIGCKYTVVDCNLAVKFVVKIGGSTSPIIENVTIRKTKEPIMVEVGEHYASFYGNSLYDCDLGVEAESITIVSPSSLATKPSIPKPTSTQFKLES